MEPTENTGVFEAVRFRNLRFYFKVHNYKEAANDGVKYFFNFFILTIFFEYSGQQGLTKFVLDIYNELTHCRENLVSLKII